MPTKTTTGTAGRENGRAAAIRARLAPARTAIQGLTINELQDPEAKAALNELVRGVQRLLKLAEGVESLFEEGRPAGIAGSNGVTPRAATGRQSSETGAE